MPSNWLKLYMLLSNLEELSENTGFLEHMGLTSETRENLIRAVGDARGELSVELKKMAKVNLWIELGLE